MILSTNLLRFVEICLAFSAILASPPALATGGSKVGDGGLAVFCSSTNSVQLFDLYEAAHERGFVFEWVWDEPNVDTSLERLKSKAALATGHGHRILSAFDHAMILDIAKVLEDVLPRTSDAGVTMVLPMDCSFRQVGFWQSLTRTLLIERDYWNRSSNADRALLLVHESLHEMLVLPSQPDPMTTVRIRRIVALLALSEPEFLSRKNEFLALVAP